MTVSAFTLVLPQAATVLALALLLDRIVGDPDWLWRRLPHPVVFFGRLISWGDRTLNRYENSDQRKRIAGTIFVLAAIAIAVVVGVWINQVLALVPTLGLFVEVLVVAVFLAHKSLLDHVRAVADGLRGGGLDGGRRAVRMIVGRDPTTLDEAGVSRAAIESLAENFSDGVVAPAFWYLVFGLPGLLAYKMINTADSMIGHLTEKHRAFGWAAARIDDVANWIPARLSALLIALVKPMTMSSTVKTIWRDALLHRSPNAGWPESAMAAVSGLALGGPRVYRGDVADEPFMNDAGRKDVGGADIRTCLRLVDRAFWIGTVLLLLSVWLVAV
ncbi:MAG: adenosylcobinamide-phosphate synthase CbiB [Pseudomonadota bacterium]